MTTPTPQKQAFTAENYKPVISNYATIGGTHLAGDATFPDGKKYRFVMCDGVVDRLHLYNSSGSYPFDNWANRARARARVIAEHALKYLPDAIAKKAARDTEEETKRLAEYEARRKEQALQDAASDLLEACEAMLPWFADSPAGSEAAIAKAQAAIAKARGQS